MELVEQQEGTWFEGSLKITYDAEVDAAYIYLMPEENDDDAVVRQIILENGPEESEIIFDIEDSRTLHGIEILGASICLPSVLIDQLRESSSEDKD